MKIITSLVLALTLSFAANANQNQSLKLVTVSTYLNFYLLNLNACEDFHPAARAEAYKAEGTLFPYFEKLLKKLSDSKVSAEDKAAIAKTVSDRRAKLNTQIADGEFTIEHCNAVISIVNEGLDSALLDALN